MYVNLKKFICIKTRISMFICLARRPTHEEIFYDSMVVPLDYDTMPARVDVALIREREALIRRLNAKHFYDGVRAMKNEGEYEGVLVGEMAIPQAKSGRRIINQLGEAHRYFFCFV